MSDDMCCRINRVPLWPSNCVPLSAIHIRCNEFANVFNDFNETFYHLRKTRLLITLAEYTGIPVAFQKNIRMCGVRFLRILYTIPQHSITIEYIFWMIRIWFALENNLAG